MQEREFKAYPLLECKTEDTGRFTGYAATYQRDSYGDRILPGAFAQSIKDHRGKIPLFYHHQPEIPIGFSMDLAEDAKGLWIDGVLAMDTTHGRDMHALLKTAHAVDYRMGLSIGFIPSEVDYDQNGGGRLLKSIELFETSITPFPANRGARVESFKSVRNVEQILRDVGGCSGDAAKRALACLRPYLSVGTDGQPQPPERDVRGQVQQLSTGELALVREGISQWHQRLR
jgi:hypothetical protein